MKQTVEKKQNQIFKEISEYTNLINDDMIEIAEIVKPLLKSDKKLNKETRERIFNEAVKLRETLKGFLIGCNYMQDKKYKMVEDKFLLELKMFDSDKIKYLSSEKIYTYKIEIEKLQASQSAKSLA